MSERDAILAELREQFSSYERPDAFIDRAHCCECEEHYDELLDVTVDSIAYRHVENAGWDPTCFLTPEAFRYYFPGLARVADEHPDDFMLTLAMRLPLHYGEAFTRHDRALIAQLLEAWWLRDDIDQLTRDHLEHAINLYGPRPG